MVDPLQHIFSSFLSSLLNQLYHVSTSHASVVTMYNTEIFFFPLKICIYYYLFSLLGYCLGILFASVDPCFMGLEALTIIFNTVL